MAASMLRKARTTAPFARALLRAFTAPSPAVRLLTDRAVSSSSAVTGYREAFLASRIAHRELLPQSARGLASQSTPQLRQQVHEESKGLSRSEDPFDSITDKIPERPVSVAEGASYSLVILAGLAVAGLTAYYALDTLLFEPTEYKVFGKGLKRVQNDHQVIVRIGSPITGYGQESRNRHARQTPPSRSYVDEDGVEHVEVTFLIRGPQGAGKCYCAMFKDKEDNEWKYTSLIVLITSPSETRLQLESYIPAMPVVPA